MDNTPLDARVLESIREEVVEGVLFEEFLAYRTPDGNIVRHGVCRYVTASGKITEEGLLKEGWRHGEWRTYHDSGAIKSVDEYENGTPCGTHRAWYEDGVLESERDFVYGNIVRRKRHWASGRIRDDFQYTSGLEHGLCRSWDESGKLTAEGIYQFGHPWEGTFVIVPGIGEDQMPPTFGEYIDLFLNRGFVIAEFSDGEFVRVLEDHRSTNRP